VLTKRLKKLRFARIDFSKCLQTSDFVIPEALISIEIDVILSPIHHVNANTAGGKQTLIHSFSFTNI